jgi:hypothetical protein
MIETPGHSSYPSGHAIESHCIAFVLACLAKYREEQVGAPPAEDAIKHLERLAARITINRTVAGVHFPVDNAAGAKLGMTLGRYFVMRAKLGGTRPLPGGLGESFDGEEWFVDSKGKQTNPDFDKADGWTQTWGEPATAPEPWAADAPLGWLWRRAEQEWR